MIIKIYLPPDPAEQTKVLEELMKKHKSISLSIDANTGKTVAEISEEKEKQLEIHPTTGKPVLLD